MYNSVWKVRSWDRVLGLPVSVKVMGITVGMALCLGLGLFWQIHDPYARLEVVEVEDSARFMAQVVAVGAATLIRTGHGDEVQRLVEDMARVSPTIGTSIRMVQVMDGQQKALAQVSCPVAGNPQERILSASVGLPGELPGRVAVEFNDSHVDFELGWHTRRILTTTAWVTAIGLMAIWGLMRWVTRPIGELVQVARVVRSGDYSARVAVRTRDELGELAVAFNAMLATHQHKEEVNQHLRRKLIQAEEEERKRVARELHDHTGQALTALIAGLAAAEQESVANPARWSELRGLATQTLLEVHDLSLALRPLALEDLGLVAALQKHVRSVAQRFGIRVDCATLGLEGGARLPSEIEVALYRIVQEALTNAVRHGRPQTVHVRLRRGESVLLAEIEDDGCGFDASDWRGRCLQGDHLGLLGIEERAVLLAGSLRVESSPGGGTRLFVEIPLPLERHG